MNKLLITPLAFIVITGLVYAQEEVNVPLHNKQYELVAETTDLAKSSGNNQTTDFTDSTDSYNQATSPSDNTNNTNQTVAPLHENVLVRNKDYYRVNKGPRGVFFIVQDFYTTGEKRTDPFLVSELDKVKINNFDILNYDHLDINGLLITWFKNGQVEQKGVFDQGKRKGLWVSWYENGHKKSAGHYLSGLKEGTWTVWYQTSKRMQKGYYQADRKEGVWIYWYGNGKKKEAGRYNDDNRVERWNYWSDSGKLVKSEVKETDKAENNNQ